MSIIELFQNKIVISQSHVEDIDVFGIDLLEFPENFCFVLD